ncbi:unnamed protein product [Caenorhabditis angaria]|uniref:Alpha-1,3-glucosyltransferase n=1 Tax=Caenorhabditis angaria TaxID=860376 RepID=A0A9P1MXE8_9PELO|nr:unnamed protein product [Caenorhabditis angaria]
MNEKITSKGRTKNCNDFKISESGRKRKFESIGDVDLSADSNSVIAISLILSCLFLIQSVLALGSYSGESTPPMFGDFEAQRHWMEITYNLPIEKWYVNDTMNDLQYWGLDYPPLTAYHHWIMGIISKKINPDWIELFESRGYESVSHKLFMRISAIIPFILFYIPPLISLFFRSSKKSSLSPVIQTSLALFYPGLLVIDNAHFQYNSISLGLFLISYCFLTNSKTLLGAMFFVLALNYKQMELYHSLPIFIVILSRSIKKPVFSNIPNSILQITKVGIVVISSFFIIWLPFILTGTAKDVLIRVFPFNRGIYEDKVASFWCAFSFILKRLPIQNIQIYLSSAAVLIFSIPSLITLFNKSSERNFRISLFTTSLSFFLFSFHVHEKTILLVAVCAILLFPDYPSDVIWFLNISNISMFSLCVKDGNSLVLMLFVAYFITSIYFWNHLEDEKIYLKSASVIIGIIVCLLELFGPIPARFPHIYQLANAFFSCVHFIYFLMSFTYRILGDSTKNIKNE